MKKSIILGSIIALLGTSAVFANTNVFMNGEYLDRDYVVFESKVIDPPNKRFIKKDRSKLDLEHSMKYGNPYEDL